MAWSTTHYWTYIIASKKMANYSDVSLSLSGEVMIVVYLGFVVVLALENYGHGNFQRLFILVL